ncbi:MAG: hypothetical protein QM754_17480 [Tepidisphaeraceae bacterium]
MTDGSSVRVCRERLSLLAMMFMTALRLTTTEPKHVRSKSPPPIPVIEPEVRRLLIAIVWPRLLFEPHRFCVPTASGDLLLEIAIR